ncbi:MAG: phosphoribosylformylglycinamidine synthase II, partial [Hyphomonadaceae bacterium]|nr:phosphoribosylformylglycinamidine synthase II [Hyphomonadaceae bacterium]
QLIRNRRVNAVHDCSDGGLIVAACEMALAANTGVALNPVGPGPHHGWLFGEDQGRYLLATAARSVNPVISTARDLGIKACSIGTFGGTGVSCGDILEVSLAELRTAHEDWLPDFMES